MKVGSSIKKRCKSCQIIIRKGRRYIYCQEDPRHKQRQG